MVATIELQTMNNAWQQTAQSAGTTADTAVTDPTLSATEIALLKGLLSQLQGNGTGAAPVTPSNRTAVTLTTTALGASGGGSDTYTQAGVDTTALPQINYVAGKVFADQPGTLYFETSGDNATWDTQVSVDFTASQTAWLSYSEAVGKYIRFRAVNTSSTAQTVFRVEQITK